MTYKENKNRILNLIVMTGVFIVFFPFQTILNGNPNEQV